MSDRLLQLCREQFGDVPEHYLKEAILIKDMCLIPNWGLSSETIEQMKKIADESSDEENNCFLKYYAKSNISQFNQTLNELAILFSQKYRSEHQKKDKVLKFKVSLLLSFVYSFSQNPILKLKTIPQVLSITDETLENHWYNLIKYCKVKELKSEEFTNWFELQWSEEKQLRYKNMLQSLGTSFKSQLFENSEQVILCYSPLTEKNISSDPWIIVGNNCIIILSQYPIFSIFSVMDI